MHKQTKRQADSYKNIYLGFYVAFNIVQVISQRVVGKEKETSTYSWLRFCTVNCWPRAHIIKMIPPWLKRGHGGRVVTLSPPTSEAGVRSLSRPEVGKLVVACHWSAVYSTEP